MGQTHSEIKNFNVKKYKLTVPRFVALLAFPSLILLKLVASAICCIKSGLLSVPINSFTFRIVATGFCKKNKKNMLQRGSIVKSFGY